MANNGDLEASIQQRYTELSKRLFDNLLLTFFQVVKMGLGRLSDLLKGAFQKVFKNQSTSKELIHYCEYIENNGQ